MDDNLYDILSDYLSGALDPESRQHFEERMAADPNLAARVALERDLTAAIVASPENQFRENLSRISKKFDTSQSLHPLLGKAIGDKAKWLIAFGVTLTLLGGLTIWKASSNTPSGPKKMQETLQSPAPENIQKADSLTQNVPGAQDLPKAHKPVHPRIMAGAFEPLPALESQIGSQLRGSNVHFRVESPQNGAVLQSRNNKTTFQLLGRIEGGLPVTNLAFNVLIFTNNRLDYEAMRPISQHLLAFGSNAAFQWQKDLELPAGLYYLLIEEEDSGERFLTSKFLVKAQ